MKYNGKKDLKGIECALDIIGKPSISRTLWR